MGLVLVFAQPILFTRLDQLVIDTLLLLVCVDSILHGSIGSNDVGLVPGPFANRAFI